MENTTIALQNETEIASMSMRKTRNENVSWTLSAGDKQLIQILAKSEGLSVSEVIFRCFTKGLKLLIDDLPVYDPAETPEDIMRKFADVVRDSPKYQRARQSVIGETVTRTDLTPQSTNELTVEIRE